MGFVEQNKPNFEPIWFPGFHIALIINTPQDINNNIKAGTKALITTHDYIWRLIAGSILDPDLIGKIAEFAKLQC